MALTKLNDDPNLAMNGALQEVHAQSPITQSHHKQHGEAIAVVCIGSVIH
jgi:hypothetical protein